ncbi:MAG: alpha/beta hydrolase [Nevskiales bacterium]
MKISVPSKRACLAPITLGCGLAVAGFLFFAAAASARETQDAAAPVAPRNLSIWPDGAAAGAGGVEQDEQKFTAPFGHERFIRNVTRASVDVYLPNPSAANGSAMIVCPGGGFRFLTMDGEGEPVAQWLNSKGTTAFILHYRLKPTPKSDLLFVAQMLFVLPSLLSGKAIGDIKPLATPAIADATQALRFIRSQAASWHLDPDRIGMIGFSAGGMVAVGASLVDDARDRPAFTAAIYSGPLDIGTVPADAPPLFTAAAADDPLTDLATRPIASAWKAGGAPVDLHIYEHGGHGFGVATKGADSDRWLADFTAWLKRNASSGR